MYGVAASMSISRCKWEGMKMGIPQEKTEQWREFYQVLDSDDIQAIQQAIDEDEDNGFDGGGEEEVEEANNPRCSCKRAISMDLMSTVVVKTVEALKSHITQKEAPGFKLDRQ
ncbi:hypothetical protein BDZ97DRAFT_1764338 [Flammula alnicola]|nr:hypothetical protein BDZ97DRAFT_1764338 [Flammula alnicola]